MFGAFLNSFGPDVYESSYALISCYMIYQFIDGI